MMLSALNTRKVIACFLVGLSAGLMSILVQELAQEFVLSSFLQGFVNFCQISEWWHLLNLSFLHIFALTMIQHSYQALRVILLHFKKKIHHQMKLWISWWFLADSPVMKGRSALDAARRAVYAACAAHAVAWVLTWRAEQQQKQLQIVCIKGRESQDQNYEIHRSLRCSMILAVLRFQHQCWFPSVKNFISAGAQWQLSVLRFYWVVLGVDWQLSQFV